MAEYKFSIVHITTDLKEKSVLIKCSLDIDEDTFSADSILLRCEGSDTLSMFDAVIDGRTIRLKLLGDITPNKNYMLVVQRGITSITGEVLDAALIKTLAFESSVTSVMNITKPVNFQKISGELVIGLEEQGDRPVNSYLLQVSSEIGFCNVLYSVKTGEKSFVLSDCRLSSPGQYFVRARAQESDEQYGAWSEPVTFTVPGTTNIPHEESFPDTDGPEIIDLTGAGPSSPDAPENNGLCMHFIRKYNDETPSCFRIVFPFEIDITNLSAILKRGSF